VVQGHCRRSPKHIFRWFYPSAFVRLSFNSFNSFVLSVFLIFYPAFCFFIGAFAMSNLMIFLLVERLNRHISVTHNIGNFLNRYCWWTCRAYWESTSSSCRGYKHFERQEYVFLFSIFFLGGDGLVWLGKPILCLFAFYFFSFSCVYFDFVTIIYLFFISWLFCGIELLSGARTL